MRTLMIPAAAMLAIPLAQPAEAQQARTTMRTPVAQSDADRWRSVPGGWAAYRRPSRGTVLPAHWNQSRHYVGDYARYGLPEPQRGYRWQRYYDDAVMVDANGAVLDTRSGIAWQDGGDGYYAGRDYADGVYDDRYDDDRVYYSEAPDAPPPPPPPARRDDGVGGAVIGGVAGGVAGNVIAGDGNRLLGTAVGAGVGAVAGAAIDRAEDRGRDRSRVAQGAGYPPPPPPASGGVAPHHAAPQVAFAPRREVVQGQGYAHPPARPHAAPPPPPPVDRDYAGSPGASYPAPGAQAYDDDPVAPDYGYADQGYAEGGYADGGYPDDGYYADAGYSEAELVEYRERYAPPPVVTHTGSRTVTTTTTYAGPGHIAGGYYFPPATTTTVVVSGGCDC